MLQKLQILAKLNEELKDYNKDYQYTKHLIENNIRRASKFWQEVNVQKEFFLARAELELEEKSKAQLVDSRWLSDWSLECTYLKDGESFIKVYEDWNYFLDVNKIKDEEEESSYNVGEFIRRFWDLLPSGKAKQNKIDYFKALA